MRLPCSINVHKGILYLAIFAAAGFTCYGTPYQTAKRSPRVQDEELRLLAADGGEIMFGTKSFRLPNIEGMTLKKLAESGFLESILHQGLRIQLENGQAPNPIPANDGRVVRVSESPFSAGDVIVIEVDSGRLGRN